MKDYKFSVKVSDLLQHPGNRDILHLHNKFSTILPQISSDGIQADVELLGLDEKTVLLTIFKAACHVMGFCDRCGNEFEEELSITDVSIKCFLEEEKPHSYGIDDDILIITKKGEMIDIEHVLVEALILQKSVKNLCSECQLMSIADPEDEKENGGTINRIKKS